MKPQTEPYLDPLLSIVSPNIFRRLSMVVVALLTSQLLVAQGGSERLFDEGNLLYQQQDFEGARDKYLQIESQDEVSSALYYNLANSYYRLGEFGKAILYYERALRLDPGDDDIQANLRAANQATVDQIVPPQEFQLARWLIWLLYLIPAPTLVKLASASYLLAGALLIVSIISRNRRIGRVCRKAALAAGIVLGVAVSIGAVQWLDSTNRVEAIILEREVRAMGSPDTEGVELFRIHEGTKVRIDQSAGDWIEIVLLDGKVGWIQNQSVEII